MNDPLQTDLSLADRNPLCFSEWDMTDKTCERLLNDLDDGDFNLNTWEEQFLDSALGQTSWSPKQKKVIYDMSRKYKLI